METSPITFMEAETSLKFYAALFTILVVVYGGGLTVALACIQWLLRHDEEPFWIKPPSSLRG